MTILQDLFFFGRDGKFYLFLTIWVFLNSYLGDCFWLDFKGFFLVILIFVFTHFDCIVWCVVSFLVGVGV